MIEGVASDLELEMHTVQQPGSAYSSAAAKFTDASKWKCVYAGPFHLISVYS